MSELKEKKLFSETIYEGKILNLKVDTVELPNGNISKREIVEYSGAVAVVAHTRDNQILLIHQYRYPAGEQLLEIPAGKLEPGEEPLHCAKRELREETGAEAEVWQKLFSFYSTPGFSTEKMHLFLASELQIKEQDLDEDEFVEVEKVLLDEVIQKIKEGKICDSKSIAGILAAKEIL
ncbi:MAG: NUDIX hydrolase [Clostridiales bacterium]|nr:NUDIX hydrolase [Clostridiales bacterium]MCF8023258.1 NUDIX hydrolase [Clostridiales bacterium]